MELIDPSRAAPSLDAAAHLPTAGMLTETADRKQLLSAMLRILITITGLLSLDALVSDNPAGIIAIVALALSIESIVWVLQRSGRVQAASLVLVAGLWLLLTAAMFAANILSNGVWILLVIIVMIAGLLLGRSAALTLAGVNTLTSLVYLLTTQAGLLPPPMLPLNPGGVWISLSLVFFAAAWLVQLAVQRIQEARFAANLADNVQDESRRELDAMRSKLDEQVAERTRDLTTQTRYQQSVIEISRATGSLLDPDQVAETAVQLTRSEFDLYYTGLFLIDAAGEWAVLQSGTGESGRRMLERGHRIRIGSGMVGWSIANAQPRIALDVGRDAVRLATPELPETRTEAAIPLRARGKVLGALSLQSQHPSAFGEIEIAVFQSLADQLALALDNARAHEETRRALGEAGRLQEQGGRRAWQDFMGVTDVTNIRYQSGKITNAPEPGDPALAAARRHALQTGRPVQTLTISESSIARSTLLLPIPVRGVVVGVISLVKEPQADKSGHAALSAGDDTQISPPAGWQPDEIDLLENIVSQLGMALDSARLYQDTQRLAYRERLAGEVTGRIRQTLDIQTVLRTAVEEIQRSLNLPDVVISLTPPETIASDPRRPGSEPRIEENAHR